jgi:hypothetical protein
MLIETEKGNISDLARNMGTEMVVKLAPSLRAYNVVAKPSSSMMAVASSAQVYQCKCWQFDAEV